MNKPNIFKKFIKKIHQLRTRKAFAEAIREHNAKQPERPEGARGLDPNKINYGHQVEQIIGYVCSNASKMINGVYKFTRSHAAKYLGVSTPTIDRYLNACKELKWITMKDRGLCTFEGGNKSIGCLYVAFDLDKFQYEEIEIKEKKAYSKNLKTTSIDDNWDYIKDFPIISP